MEGMRERRKEGSRRGIFLEVLEPTLVFLACFEEHFETKTKTKQKSLFARRASVPGFYERGAFYNTSLYRQTERTIAEGSTAHPFYTVSAGHVRHICAQTESKGGIYPIAAEQRCQLFISCPASWKPRISSFSSSLSRSEVCRKRCHCGVTEHELSFSVVLFRDIRLVNPQVLSP